MTAHINIGSNIGHRAEQISRAVSLLQERLGAVTQRSTPFVSQAWGYDSAAAYTNVGVNVETGLDAASIVDVLKAIEQTIAPGESHRDAVGGYTDRHIDLDLISLDDAVIDVPGATVPHQRMHEREFVLRPMAEILPGWRHPRLGVSVEKLLEELHNKKH